MTDRERLRQLIEARHDQLRAELSADTRATIVALTRARDSLHLATERAGDAPIPLDIVEKRRLYELGWNKVLRLCFEDPVAAVEPGSSLAEIATAEWADRTIRECGHLADVELVLAHAETGFMQLSHDGVATFHAWVTTKRMPTVWREREDFAWWGRSLAERLEPAFRSLSAERPHVLERLRAHERRHGSAAEASAAVSDVDGYYRRLATTYTRRMAHQHSYPPSASIGGCTFQVYVDVLGLLIGWMLEDLDRSQAAGQSLGDADAEIEPALAMPRSETRLVEALARALGIEPELSRRALTAFILDGENARYHGAPAGVAAPPLIRAGEDHVVWSAAGLLTEPILFLTRELKRRYTQEYHNTAHLREDVFREDLYRLFADKRFVTSAGTVELKREVGGVRTDLDALVFDRKTGTLGVFELKAQDLFARSQAERMRQRDNFYHANRQISALMQWLQRNDAMSLLARVDPATAKRFRVHKVYAFVLGRYLAHFADGPEPDRRAAWGTWPQVLRLLEERAFDPSAANPLASLFTRLVKDAPLVDGAGDRGVREVSIGDARLRVYPSFAAYKGGAS